jgi:hypothetical protein
LLLDHQRLSNTRAAYPLVLFFTKDEIKFMHKTWLILLTSIVRLFIVPVYFYTTATDFTLPCYVWPFDERDKILGWLAIYHMYLFVVLVSGLLGLCGLNTT